MSFSSPLSSLFILVCVFTGVFMVFLIPLLSVSKEPVVHVDVCNLLCALERLYAKINFLFR